MKYVVAIIIALLTQLNGSEPQYVFEVTDEYNNDTRTYSNWREIPADLIVWELDAAGNRVIYIGDNIPEELYLTEEGNPVFYIPVPGLRKQAYKMTFSPEAMELIPSMLRHRRQDGAWVDLIFIRWSTDGGSFSHEMIRGIIRWGGIGKPTKPVMVG